MAVPELSLRLTPENKDASSDTRGDDDFTVSAVDEAAVAPVIRSHHGLEGLDDGTLIVGGIYHLAEGSKVTLTGPAGSAELTVHVEEGGFGPVITPAVVHRLVGDAPTARALWARTSGDGSDAALVVRVRETQIGRAHV